MAKVVPARHSHALLFGLVLLHLAVVSRQIDAGGGTSLLEKSLYAALSPVQTVVGGGMRGAADAWRGYVGLRGVREENVRLQERLREMEAELLRRQQDAQEVARLRELLDLKPGLPFETIPAEVVARDGVPWFRTVTLNRGAQHGIRLHAPVISSTGVVGRIVALGPNAAKVQLLLDKNSGVGVRIDRTRFTGVATGVVSFSDQGRNELVMKYVPSVADVAVGDVVVTSGLDQLFPAGLVVGRVRAVGPSAGLFKDVQVAPSAGFDVLEAVLVVRHEAPDLAFTEVVR